MDTKQTKNLSLPDASNATGSVDASFAGYPLPTSNTTYTPNQFFDVVLPNSSRGVVRLVGYMVRRVLGWSKPDGTPLHETVTVSYRELIENAGISRGAIRQAIDEAIEAKFIRCVSNGQKHAPLSIASSSSFELCWDDSGQYITNPLEFNGFFSGNGNLTYIPNAFFDHTICQESLSVVQVIGAIIRHSIGFQTYHGFRRQEVSLSFDDLMKIAKIDSRSTVNLAIKEALSRNHIVRLESGSFGNGVLQSKSKYGIRWQSKNDASSPTLKVETEGVISGIGSKIEPEILPSVQKSNQKNRPESDPIGSKIEPEKIESVQKSNQESVQKSNQNRFKNRTSIEITNLNNNKQQQQTLENEEPKPIAVVVCVDSVVLLKEIGFDSKTANDLASRFSKEEIQQQIDWLPLRKIKTNKLGLLRKSIEEAWAPPEGKPQDLLDGLARVFAKFYYAGYHDNAGEPLSEPFDSDVESAKNYLSKLGLTENDKQAAVQGRAFGQLAKIKLQGNRSAKPILSSTLVLYGDEFAKNLRGAASSKKQDASYKAKNAHKEANWSRYIAYLGLEEKALKKANLELYGIFEKSQNETLESMKQFKLDPSKFQTDSARLIAFAEFFAHHGDYKVLGFWDWDKKFNPSNFQLKEVGNA